MNLKNLITALFAWLCLSASLLGQIQAGKPVVITILGVPAQEKSAIDGTYPVSDGGTINMPYLGLIRAAGVRSEDLSITLQSRYRAAGIYTNPTIQVISTAEGGTINQQQVFIGGQVRRSGPVPFSNDLTLWQAVQAAGGPTEFGSMKRVKLLRGGAQKTYDLTQPQFMRIPLRPNDAIEVPQKTPWGS
jgi:protein involved in polysaccharide export with SLBB domain